MTKADTERVQRLISEALLMVALDHVNPRDVEDKLYRALKPYFKKR